MQEFYGETEITPEELYQYSKGATRLQQFMVNFILLLVVGLFCVFVLPKIFEYFGVVTTSYKEVKKESGFAGVAVDAMMSPRRMIMLTMALGTIAFVVMKLCYAYIVRPYFKTMFLRTSHKWDAVAEAMAGKVVYKVDRYGLEYNIESAKATNKFKLYWRNFTDAEYSPEIIRFFKGKKQTAFVLMRAFPGNERQVGQFIEATMNKQKARG